LWTAPILSVLNPIAVAAFIFPTQLWYTFVTVAFFHELTRAYAGERPSFVRGLGFSCSRIAPILSWSFLSASVWMIIQLSGVDPIGPAPRMVLGLGSMAWSVIAMFATPMLLRGGTHFPLALLRLSWASARQNWTELLCLLAGWFVGNGLFFGFAKVLQGLDPTLAAHPVTILAARVFYFAVLYIFASIYLCALYIYATEGVVPGPLRSKDMDAVWQIRAH